MDDIEVGYFFSTESAGVIEVMTINLDNFVVKFLDVPSVNGKYSYLGNLYGNESDDNFYKITKQITKEKDPELFL